MSRYECQRAGDVLLGVLSGQEAHDEGVLTGWEARAGQHALIIGDPDASAYSVAGTPAELLAFLDRARAQVAALLVDDATGRDDHWPAWVLAGPGVGLVIGCACGDTPASRPKRMSSQHMWHMAHRRRLRLRPVEYAWPASAEALARTTGRPQLSTGGYVQVRDHAWVDGEWVRTGRT